MSTRTFSSATFSAPCASGCCTKPHSNQSHEGTNIEKASPRVAAADGRVARSAPPFLLCPCFGSSRRIGSSLRRCRRQQEGWNTDSGIRKGLGFRRVRAEVAGGGGGAAAGGRVRVRTAAGATRGEMRESNQRRRRICGHAGEAEQGI